MELRLRRRLEEKGLAPDEIESRVTKYMKEYDQKEYHRKIYLAGKTFIDKAKANVRFEREVWPKMKKELSDKE